MFLTKSAMLGGLMGAALIAGLAVEPAHAGSYFSLSFGSGGYYYTPVRTYDYYRYSGWGPCYTPSYREVCYQSCGYVPYVPAYTYPVYPRYVPRVYSYGPSYRYYSGHTGDHHDYGRRFHISHIRHGDHDRSDGHHGHHESRRGRHHDD